MHTLQRERSSQRLAACVTQTTPLVQPQRYPVCPGRTGTSPSQETGDQFIPTGQNLASQIKKSRHPFPFFQWNSMTCSKRFLSYCLDSFINKFFMGKKKTLQQIQKLKKNIAEDFFENKGVRGKLKISQVMQAAMVTGQMLIMHQRAKANHTNCCSPSQSNSIFQATPPKKIEFYCNLLHT